VKRSVRQYTASMPSSPWAIASTPDVRCSSDSGPDRLLNEHGEVVVNDVGLAALTLLIAESDPANKETMIQLIMNMLARTGEVG
jgi:hypothetical protein